jgi:hypothetical protein
MADEIKPQPGEPTAWDRFGQILEDMATLGSRMANRNVTLWTGVAQNVRTKGRYTPEDLTSDLARTWTTAMDNLDDAWTFWTRIPDRERVAADLPTAFLLLRPTGSARPSAGESAEGAAGYGVDDPVWVRVPPALDQPPLQAKLALAGADADAAAALESCLRTTLAASKTAYRLEFSYPESGMTLTPGTYSGVVYVEGNRPMALANLRIVVRPPHQGG